MARNHERDGKCKKGEKFSSIFSFLCRTAFCASGFWEVAGWVGEGHTPLWIWFVNLFHNRTGLEENQGV